MCGIAGEVRQQSQIADRGRLERMSGALARRGPDGHGLWIDGQAGFVHRRLAIVDLSETGKQPMISLNGRYAITFNGEIYNYQELKEQFPISNFQFRTTSDTEVILALYEKEGEAMLKRLRGMFAFAIWDKEKNELFFARDRVGKKPFFWMNDERGFAFASEVQALVERGHTSVDREALRTFFGLQYVPSPATGFRGIQSLPPAHCGTWKEGAVSIWRYDSFDALPSFTGSFDEAAVEVRRRFEEAVRYRLIADVEVGCFLSGGIDSSVVAAEMAKRSSKPIKTFTMGFPDFAADERAEAAAFAKTIGAEHHAFEAKPLDAVLLVDKLVDLYGVPYADSSCLPSYLLAQETSKHVKAVMNGDGGDESFGGYKRYAYFRKALTWRALAHIPILGRLSFRDPRVKRMLRTIMALSAGDAAGYAQMFTGSYFCEQDMRDLLQPEFAMQTQDRKAERFIIQNIHTSGVGAAMEFDRDSYLPDDLCVKMDRATMAHGLEARSPLLDQELVRFAATLPADFHFRGGRQKAVLQSAVSDLVPSEILSRPKRGFQVPLGAWFRLALKPSFEERCLAPSSKLHRYCRPEAVKRLYDEHQAGVDHGNRLWMLLSLSTWLEQYD